MARLRDGLVAHAETADSLNSSLQGEGMSLTLLFAGPSGVGKKLTAQVLAQDLLCETSTSACGRCGSCLRVEHGAHEGLLIVEPDGLQIKIDQTRRVLEFLQLQRISRSRVIIIDQAQQLNPQAANSLLKVFEEPPEGTFIFLIAPSPTAVLSTLRSRSRTVLFRPLTEDELKKIQVAPDWAIKASRGSVEVLKSLLQPEEQESRSESVQILTEFLGDPAFLTAQPWRQSLKEKGFYKTMLTHWVGLLRDGLFLHSAGHKHLMNPDQKKVLDHLVKIPRTVLDELVQRFLRLESEMGFHRDPQLSIEEAWVFYQEKLSQ